MAILPPFDGPRLKVRRARKHIQDLQSVIAEFGARVKIGLIHAGDEGEGALHQSIYRFHFSEDPPEEIPAIIGDAIHNMRAALDIMVCDIARLRGKSTDKLKFPFAKDAIALDLRLSKEYPRLGQDVVGAIRAEKPYKGGNIALRGLHDLDCDDKHETVLPFYLYAESQSWVPEIMNDMLKRSLNVDLTQFRRIYSEHLTFSVPPGMNPWSFVRLLPGPPQPIFPKGLPFSEAPIVEVLERLADVVDEVVERFFSEFGHGNTIAAPAPIGDNQPIENA